MKKEKSEQDPDPTMSTDAVPSSAFGKIVAYAESAGLDISVRSSPEGHLFARLIFGDSDTGKHSIRIDNERAELLAPYHFAD